MLGRRALLFVASVFGASAVSDWDALNMVTHRRSYGFVLRDGTCVTGKIATVTADSIKIRNPGPLTLNRADVVRVSDGQHVYDIVYTARSSWSDVATVPPNQKEHLRVLTKTGKQEDGVPTFVDAGELTLNKRGKISKITKADVSQVHYVRLKPMSDSAAYAAQEAGLLDPEL